MFRFVPVCAVGILASLTPSISFAQGSGGSSGQSKITVIGNVTDGDDEPLAGASIIVRGTSIGTYSDSEGNYTITFPSKGNNTLVYSFMGMKAQEIAVQISKRIDVQLLDDASIDAVVVNGFYAQQKETFTGAATTISGEQLVNVSPTNLITGIASLTPGMVVVENNAMGSDPNTIPSVLIRGANTLITNDSEEGVNNPLIILDGVEISMTDLYDLDIFDIERVDVLKDASAAILYGEKAANGVIVIERKRIEDARIKLSYNFVPKISIPDLSSFNLCNAEQKLELERLSGMYETDDGSMDRAYAYKLQNVRKGVNTNWLKAPLRIPFSHTHSLSLTSRTDALEYRATANFSDTYGVMKGDNRRTFGLNFALSYHLADKLTLSWQTNYSMTTSKDSPYGTFSSYVQMNPYNPIYDENGDLIKTYYFNPYSTTSSSDSNPLYDATLSSFSKSQSQSLTNSISGRWNITKHFYVTGQGNLGMSWSTSDTYVSPETAANLLVTDITKRGSYTFSRTNRTSVDGKIVINYGRSLDSKGSMFRVSGGSNIEYTRSRSASAQGIGFLKDELSDISFALSYPTNGYPNGTDKLSTGVGFFANGNIGFRNRYFADLSYRTSGSSKFGSSNSFAPFWSLGAGWNVHNENFAKKADWLNTLTFRYSVGYTGSVSFDYYQAQTIYQYKSSYQYYTGIGAIPNQMGNSNLKWQRTLNNNFGVTGAFLDSRINFSVDYYINTTYDMLMSIDLPPSVGATFMSVNFGELINQGVDISISAQIIRNKNWMWTMTVTGGHVMDKIMKISDAMKNVEVSDAYDSYMPKILFQEGGSQFDIYAMRSAGIDPATGEEIFIKKNGEYTYNYDSDERVAVGNTNPILRGSWLNTVRWKRFSLNITTSYTFGADYYNTTLQSKVENIDRFHNVDVRAFTERWKGAGDLSRYLDIASTATSHYSERFVEKRNELYISNFQFLYDVPMEKTNFLGMRKLVVGFGLSDIARISTVKFERGTSYPYTRGINITFRPTF